MIEFTKIHGIGNDYIFIDDREENIKNPSELAKKMSLPHFGIGADGIILVRNSQKADFFMRIFNADGSEAEMCGNGIRGFGKFVYENKLTNKKELKIETLAGIKNLELYIENEKVKSARVDLGSPIFEPEKIPVNTNDTEKPVKLTFNFQGKEYIGYAVSMGNPHCVFFIENIEEFPLQEFGPYIENHKIFPNRTNVEIVEIKSNKIYQRTWERGSGETLACGTGASAVCVVTHLVKKLPPKQTITLKGGELEIEWDRENNIVFLKGDVEAPFRGIWLLD